MRERREEARRPAPGVRGRVRLGHGLVIVDVSSRGALVEGRSPLRPGSRVEVQLETDARRELIAARVTRMEGALLVAVYVAYLTLIA